MRVPTLLGLLLLLRWLLELLRLALHWLAGIGAAPWWSLTALDRLPTTFCHQDAFRRNLLLRAGPDNRQRLKAKLREIRRHVAGQAAAQP